MRKNLARAQAIAEGRKTYQGDKPCPKGHGYEKYISKSSCVECAAEACRLRQADRDSTNAYKLEYRSRPGNRDKDREYAKRRYDAKTEELLAAKRTEAARAAHRKWQSTKEAFDDNFRLGRQLRANTKAALKHIKDTARFYDWLGCTVAFLRDYVESQFQSGMTWENHGAKWQLDHRKTLGSFDLTDPEQFAEAAHYTNLQPLWIEDHRRKLLADRKTARERHGSQIQLDAV